MRSKTIIIVVFWLVTSCKTKLQDQNPPIDVLDKEAMINLLVDIHLAESYGYMLRLENEEKIHLEQEEYSKVLKMHNVSLVNFEHSYDWYISHPVVFDLVYDEIIERINMQEQYVPEYLDDEKSEEIPTETGEMHRPLPKEKLFFKKPVNNND